MEKTNIKDVLHQFLGVKSPWVIEKTDIHPSNKVIDIFINYERGSKFNCPVCQELCNVHDCSYRRWRYLDWFEYRCYLNIKIPRVKCEKHGVKVINNISWGRMNSHYSYMLECNILELIKEMSMSALSKYIGEPDNNLWRVFNHYVGQALTNQLDLSNVEHICVDETACKRGHSYVTIFSDYDTGEVILTEAGRKKEVFSKLYGWLFDKGGHPKKIKYFSMDMSKSYIAGQHDYFAHSEVTFDRFHIKKELNKAVNMVRKKEVIECDELKKTKYIWLKNENSLTLKQKSELDNFLEQSNLKTVTAYKLKKEFDNLWEVQKHAVVPLLNKWIERTLDIGFKPMNRFVNTVCKHYEGIVNAMKTKITNALAEGINSIIQLARSRARGFRNIENFKAMIYFLGNNFELKNHT